MGKSAKPRKAYKPRGKGIPMVFRHPGEVEQDIQLYPHMELLKLRNGAADAGSWHEITCRINVGITLALQNGLEAALQVVAPGLDAMREIRDRFQRVGKYGATGEEIRIVGDALVATDEMQRSMTRRQLSDAIKHVYKVAVV
jgi:hypothetical protein